MKTSVKFGVLGALAMGALAMVGCTGSQTAAKQDANMGSVSGDSSQAPACCSKAKDASMGAVSGDSSNAPACCTKQKAASMGAVSGECSKSTTCTKSN